MIVSNSTPLIYLARLNKLYLLREFFAEVYIPREVYREVVVRGKEEGYADALLVEEAIKEGWIRVENAPLMKKLLDYGIDRGEAEAISLALKLKCRQVLIDQSHARLAAEVVGLTPRGTLFVLLKALREGTMTFEGYLEHLEALVRVNFRMSDEVYIEAVRLGRKLAEK
ncbi:DUF3368 domain-containing protein [Candidatus Pyrohabitans sp.]